jgi:hypothetical protein
MAPDNDVGANYLGGIFSFMLDNNLASNTKIQDIHAKLEIRGH